MMIVKGVALISIPLFIKNRFGDQSLQIWLNALSPEAKQIFSQAILPIATFPMTKFFSEPMQVMCKLFFNSSKDGAVELGKFSAEYALSGVFKFFIKFGSPSFITKKASSILPTYYIPSKMEVVEADENHGIVRITHFAEITELIEYRILGWMVKAIELSGMVVKVDITKSLSSGDPYTEYVGNWTKKIK